MNGQIEIYTILVSIVSLLMLLSVFIVVFVIKYRQKQNAFEEEKRQIKFEQEKELMKAQLEISEDIMKSISLEIHDNIGQSLSLAKLTLHGINNENYNQQSEQTIEILSRAIANLRNLSKSLNGNFIREIGLLNSIQRESDLLNASGQIKCTFHFPSTDIQISEPFEVILFRCIQESINNCLKHAQATELSITCSSTSNALIVTIADNGIGMDLTEQTSNGLGLSSMKDRARLMGGKIEISSGLKNGTSVTFEIPSFKKFQTE